MLTSHSDWREGDQDQPLHCCWLCLHFLAMQHFHSFHSRSDLSPAWPPSQNLSLLPGHLDPPLPYHSQPNDWLHLSWIFFLVFSYLYQLFQSNSSGETLGDCVSREKKLNHCSLFYSQIITRVQISSTIYLTYDKSLFEFNSLHFILWIKSHAFHFIHFI